MEKLKWKYSKIEFRYYADKFNVRSSIQRKNKWVLYTNRSRIRIVGFFKKLSSAKKVAQLINNG